MLLEVGADRGVTLLGGAAQIGGRKERIDAGEDDLLQGRRGALRFLKDDPVRGATESPLDGRMDRGVALAYDRLAPVVVLLATPPERHREEWRHFPERDLAQNGQLRGSGGGEVERADRLTIVDQGHHQ